MSTHARVAAHRPVVRWVWYAALLHGAACSPNASEAAADARSGTLLLKDHGVAVGDVIAPLDLSCTDGAARRLGAPGASQFVTISTTGDCTECHRHLAGVEWLRSRNALTVDQFIVTYAPVNALSRTRRHYAATVEQPVCFDTAGALWDAHDITATPVSVLLKDGRIVLAHDAPLDTPEARNALLDGLASAGVTADGMAADP